MTAERSGYREGKRKASSTSQSMDSSRTVTVSDSGRVGDTDSSDEGKMARSTDTSEDCRERHSHSQSSTAAVKEEREDQREGEG